MKDATTLTSGQIQARLGLCAAAVAGAAASCPTTAEAAIVSYSTPISVPATIDGIYINLQTGATGATGGATPGWDFNPYRITAGSALGAFWNSTTLPAGAVETAPLSALYADLAPGSVVGPASTYSAAVAGTSANYRDTGTSILGFRFLSSTGIYNYGYASITTTGTTGFPATINGWSYEDTGLPITTPNVPEPATALAALALGAVGLRRQGWRRRAA